jgi:hypothetical protein
MKKYFGLCALTLQICGTALFSMAVIEHNPFDAQIANYITRPSQISAQASIMQLLSNVPKSEQPHLRAILELQLFLTFNLIYNHCSTYESKTVDQQKAVLAYQALSASQPSIPTIEGNVPDSVTDFQIELMNLAQLISQDTVIATNGLLEQSLLPVLQHLARFISSPQSPNPADTFKAYVIMQYAELISTVMNILEDQSSISLIATPENSYMFQLRQRGAYYDALSEAQQKLYTYVMAHC